MNRTKIEKVLMEMGIPAGIKGFDFIADAVEYIDNHGLCISVTKELYPDIAKKYQTKPSRVERAIRHAFIVARSTKGNHEIAEKYIGFTNCSNFNSIVMLHKKIKQGCQEAEEEKAEIENPEITVAEIRNIFREELRIVLCELKGVKNEFTEATD